MAKTKCCVCSKEIQTMPVWLRGKPHDVDCLLKKLKIKKGVRNEGTKVRSDKQVPDKSNP